MRVPIYDMLQGVSMTGLTDLRTLNEANFYQNKNLV